ncbi:MAG: hypothetical protein WBA09_22175 [Candidatus Acidiferrum sp.]
MMISSIKQVIEKHIWAYGPNRKGCVVYSSAGVRNVAEEIGISYEAANELVRDWIRETF